MPRGELSAPQGLHEMAPGGLPEDPPEGSRFFDLSKRQSGFCLFRQKGCTLLPIAHMRFMKACIRANSLTLGGSGEKSLGGMEKHGLRDDKTSQERRVRDLSPLVYGGLNLRQLFDEHVSGARMNKGLKRPAMHALVQFPTNIPITPTNEKKMLKMAVQFINETHGGDAVFAARMDRDEEGRHNVDVFYAPKYEKITKSKGAEIWISNSKHGKELCHKHKEAIVTRHREGKFTTGPRQVGIALQEELHAFFRRYNINLDERKKKDRPGPDRLSPEARKVQIEEKRRAAQESENKSLKTALAHLYKAVMKAGGIPLPNNVRIVLEKLYQKQFGDQSLPKGPADPGPSQAPGEAKPRRSDGPTRGPS